MMKKRNRVLWLFILPSFCGFLLFLLLPWGYNLLLTFFKQSGRFDLNGFMGLQNYSDVLASPSFRLAFFDTLKFMLIAIPFGVLLSLLVGIFVLSNKAACKKQQAWRFFCLIVPMMIPSVSVSIICGEVFALDGTLNRLFHTNIDFLGFRVVFLHHDIDFFMAQCRGYDTVNQLWLSENSAGIL